MNSSNTKPKTRVEEETHVSELVDEFLRNHNPENMDNVVFRGARFDAGLAWIHFPEGEGGLGMRPNLQRIIERRMREAGAEPTDPTTFFMSLAGPTISTHGTEEQKKRFLKPMYTGCLLYTSPSPRD